MEPEAGQEKGPKIPDSVIRAALLRRAVEDIRRIIQIRTSKQALNTLLQRGSVGEDLNQRFLAAEKEIDEELRDVVSEVGSARAIWHSRVYVLTLLFRE
jgi:translocation protein SEC66